MLIDNLTLMILFQTLVLTAGVLFHMLHMFNNKKQETAVEEESKAPIIEIEEMPEQSKGFGYVKGKTLILNKFGVPYLYKTYREAEKNIGNVTGAERIVFQQWDLETKTVFIGEVKHGSNKRSESKQTAQ